jgi:hypothetical protein
MKKTFPFVLILLSCTLLSGCKKHLAQAEEKFTVLKEFYLKNGHPGIPDFHRILGHSDNEKKTGIKTSFSELETWTYPDDSYIVYLVNEDKTEISVWKKASDGDNDTGTADPGPSGNPGDGATQKTRSSVEIRPGETFRMVRVDRLILVQ